MDDGIDQLVKDIKASGGLCLDCKVNPRHKRALECKACLDKKAPGRTGLKVAACRCNCGYTCGRVDCPLPFEECMQEHWREDCGHKWDGPRVEISGGFSVTCSLCGASALAHDCAVGP